MAEYITLLGAEDVRSAGHSMSSAATEMKRAAGEISYALEQHHRFLDDWLMRFQDAMLRDVNVGPCALCKAGVSLSKDMPAYHVTEYWEGHERALIYCNGKSAEKVEG